MGNQACCLRPRRSPQHVYTATESGNGVPAGKVQTSSGANPVPHINEREQDENVDDPSSHPTTEPLFKEKSRPDLLSYASMRRRKSHYDNLNAPTAGSGDTRVHKKFSSCSTIYIDDSTVSQPNLKNSIKAVALAIYYHIRKRAEADCTIDIFDERLHPLSREPVPDDYSVRDPEHRQIYRFIRTLFSAAQLTAECAIVTLVYLERLLIYAEITLLPSNWRRITLGAILLASKVWDDQAVWNVDYCQILKDTTVEDMNELERVFLEQLQFNINVPSSVYAKYYFDLRALADASELGLPMEPLSREKALKLEATSAICEDALRETTKQRLIRSNSLDGMSSPRSNAILS